MPLETHRADSISYNCMNMQGLFDLAIVAGQIPGGMGLFQYVSSNGTGSMHRALDFLLGFAVGNKTWPFSQEDEDVLVWTKLAPQLRHAYQWTGNKFYEDAIADLPWPNGTWPMTWMSDRSQLLWPIR
jgi:hypothetical protein